MGNDISRNYSRNHTKDSKESNYKGVRWQQGRVMDEYSNNDASSIYENDQQLSRVDIIGPYGTPDDGFQIQPILGLGGLIDAGKINFLIKAGTLYLGGLRLELKEDEYYRLQKDWLQQSPELDLVPDLGSSERFDLVYIEAWQQSVCAVEDESLFDVALGVDTTTRIFNFTRVHLAADLGYLDCADAWQQLLTYWKRENLGEINNQFERIPDARLTVTFSDAGITEDLCTPNIAGGYLGAENQAIRVQIVDSSHLTWGFDNASPLYRVTVTGGNTIRMLTEPKDQYHWPLTNQVVEILPWSAVLPNGEKIAEQSGFLTKVKESYTPDSGIFAILDPLSATFGNNWESRSDYGELKLPSEYFYLRVWNRGTDFTSEAKINFSPDVPIPLGQTGLQVTLKGTDFVAFDYWVIAARPETPNRVVPWELEEGMLPHGVRRFFAPLAVVRWTNDATNDVDISGEVIHDCRKKFKPLTELGDCCTYHVGDGIKSHGDYNSIQDAIDSLPSRGGKICLLPGVHTTNAEIKNRQHIHISGCGIHSIVRPEIEDDERRYLPVFQIKNSQWICLENMNISTLEGIGIQVNDNLQENDNIQIPSSREIMIRHNHITALIHAVRVEVPVDVSTGHHIHIVYNRINMIDEENGEVAIFSMADDVLIERNRLSIVPFKGGSGDDDGGDDIGEDDCVCDEKKKLHRRTDLYRLAIMEIINIASRGLSEVGNTEYKTKGGIQIGSGSERVSIQENVILGGRGNGITLGDWDKERLDQIISVNNEKHSYSALYDITIQENQIQQMDLSGIGVAESLEGLKHWVLSEDITIYRNTIKYCARNSPNNNSRDPLDQGAVGGVILHDCVIGKILENRIEDNGSKAGGPVCGIYVHYGEKMDISSNTILKNDKKEFDINSPVWPGNRGGIVVRMSFQAPEILNWNQATSPSFDGIPAVTANHNIVDHPLGHALFLMAFGPVSVIGNQFTTFGTDKSNPLSKLGAAVFIMNLGVSKDLLAIGFRNIANLNLQTYGTNLNSDHFQPVLHALQFLPSGKIMFSENQTTLDMRSASPDMGISSQFLVSLDDIAFNNNQSECAGYFSFNQNNPARDIILFNSFLIGASLRSNDNRFLDGLTQTGYSLFSYAYMNTALGNQASRCLLTLGSLKAFANNLILFPEGCKDKREMVSDVFVVPDRMENQY